MFKSSNKSSFSVVRVYNTVYRLGTNSFIYKDDFQTHLYSFILVPLCLMRVYCILLVVIEKREDIIEHS